VVHGESLLRRKSVALQPLFKPPSISVACGLAFGSHSPIFVMQPFRGPSVRIDAIRAGMEARFFQTCDVPRIIVCCPAFHGSRALENDCRRARCRCVEQDVNEILLRRACAGLLSRMRTFDWQIIHGHNVGGIDGRGANLNVFA
jgi:hypothetical protein